MVVDPDALLKGLPSAAALRRSSGRSETFGDLKDWARGLQKQGSLLRAGRCLGLEHRHAILRFLSQESLGGVRQSRARELLAALSELPEFAEGVDVEQEEVPVEELEASACDVPSADPQAGPPAGSGLPATAQLEDLQADGRELFQQLRAWVRAERQASHLAEAGAELGFNYRRVVFEFLAAFAEKKTVFRLQAREMLQRLAACDTWRQGAAAESPAVVAALAAAESGHGSDSGSFSPPLHEQAEAMAAMSRVGPPSQAMLLEDAKGDPHEVLRQLSSWVEGSRRSGTLSAEARALDASHRQAIVDFLCADRRAAGQALAKRASWPQWLPKKSLPTDGPGSPVAGVAPESYYVLQSLAELGDWFCEDSAGDRSAISRTLAQMPRAG